ncbi:hypothetical protein BS47DRAFT_1101950 [Hydnum rufescens UP504]|uniref:Uncharacterized protein n=1 Tax=Hydnum rufescens UP504 TaxID=1448309 RepID=A0A9P6AUI3_9AGAM|nr:hypothetical protein BS47DRAFT_1101950 [Hydnum rufescens UP504]
MEQPPRLAQVNLVQSPGEPTLKSIFHLLTRCTGSPFSPLGCFSKKGCEGLTHRFYPVSSRFRSTAAPQGPVGLWTQFRHALGRILPVSDFLSLRHSIPPCIRKYPTIVLHHCTPIEPRMVVFVRIQPEPEKLPRVHSVQLDHLVHLNIESQDLGSNQLGLSDKMDAN